MQRRPQENAAARLPCIWRLKSDGWTELPFVVNNASCLGYGNSKL